MDSKRDSVMAVFETVVSCGEISRAGISEMTGFSQVTVGKAVELLDRIGVVVQHKQIGGTVGRKAGLCRPETGRGMLLFDFTGDRIGVRICDIGLDVKKEYLASSDISEAFLTGFSDSVEIFGDGIIGIGCSVPDGETVKYREAFNGASAFVPDLILESRKAFAYANAFRFEPRGCWISLRITENKKVSGAVMNGSKPYSGAHGRGGDLGKMTADENFPNQLSALCELLDPSVVHIVCSTGEAVDALNSRIVSAFSDIGTECTPQFAVESTDSCRDALEGVARALRENYIVSKLANYS